MKKFDPGSFRDPAGRIFQKNNDIFRELSGIGSNRFNYIKSQNIYKNLIKEEKLILTEEVSSEEDGIDLIKHKKIPFWTYPYEWCFDQLKDAALFHIDLHLQLLENNVNLIDASAFNVQFLGSKPVFIDILSLEKYKNGEMWKAQSQFGREFLNPLVYSFYSGLPFNNIYKGNLNGVSNEEVLKVISFFRKFNLTIFLNIFLPNYLEKKHSFEKKIKRRNLDIKSFKWMLNSLRKFINSFKKKSNSFWENYEDIRTYNQDQINLKKKLVFDFIKRNQPKKLFDFGCNNGEFSILSHDAGAKYVISVDQDEKCLNNLYNISKVKKLNILPIVGNFMNPSSNLGWNQNERKGFLERGNFDASINLAVIHHMCLANNLLLNEAINSITNSSNIGLIEFVDANDTTSKIILQNKNFFPEDYNEKNFINFLEKNAKIVNTFKLTDTRKIFEFSKL